MPIYEYLCSHCNAHHEIEQKISEDELSVCPLCHEKALKKVFSPSVGFQFKGTGFYATDYQQKGCGSCCSSCPKAKTTT